MISKEGYIFLILSICLCFGISMVQGQILTGPLNGLKTNTTEQVKTEETKRLIVNITDQTDVGIEKSIIKGTTNQVDNFIKEKWKVKMRDSDNKRDKIPDKLYFYDKDGNIKKEIEMYKKKGKWEYYNNYVYSKSKDKVGIIRGNFKELDKSGISLNSIEQPQVTQTFELYNSKGNLIWKNDNFALNSDIKLIPNKNKFLVLYLNGNVESPYVTIYDIGKEEKRVINFGTYPGYDFTENGEYMVLASGIHNIRIAKMTTEGEIVWDNGLQGIGFGGGELGKGIGISKTGKYIACSVSDDMKGSLYLLLFDENGNYKEWGPVEYGWKIFEFSEDEKILNVAIDQEVKKYNLKFKTDTFRQIKE